MNNSLIFLIFCSVLIAFTQQAIIYDISQRFSQSNEQWNQIGSLILEDQQKDAKLQLDNQQPFMILYDEAKKYQSECQNQQCYYLFKIEMSSESIQDGNEDYEKNFYTSISLQAVLSYSEQQAEYLELIVNSNKQLIGIKYGLRQKEQNTISAYGSSNDETQIIISESIESLSIQQQIQEEVEKEETEIEKQKEQSFFQKYFWQIAIGLLIFFMFSNRGQQQEGAPAAGGGGQAA